ncbi:hypothetical protein [Paradevosia shaoguanensis]|uniref:hypothetical protein n=1 Tax=Paradevosia shaoguanensis TaxID=1335043 RepID=UPI00193432DC|nr:hypothetical protein [Paradevosia shaoguanensis]
MKASPRSEIVTFGTDYAGKINVTGRGCETFGPADQYIATFPTIQAARKALFELHRDSQQALLGR